MNKTINCIYLKVADKYNIEKEFDFDQEVNVNLKGEIVERRVKNNQDGSADVILIFKAMDFIIKDES